MGKYSTWVTLKPENPFKEIMSLFPEGIPTRDPFPMVFTGDGVSLWVIDCDRLNDMQIVSFVKVISTAKQVSWKDILNDVISNGENLFIQHKWINKMFGGADTYWRTLELANFLDLNNTDDLLAAKINDFLNDHYNKWVDNDITVPALPSNYDNYDSRLQTPELKECLENNLILEINIFELL